METKDIVSLAVSGLAACVAAYAAVYTRHAVHSQKTAEKWSANHGFLVRVYEMLVTNPELLHLHGLSPEDLAQDGVSVSEFTYIHLHMDAGSAFYHIGGAKNAKLTEVRKAFLDNPKVRTVWKKHLSGRFFSPSHPYSIAVDAYIAEIEARIQA